MFFGLILLVTGTTLAAAPLAAAKFANIVRFAAYRDDPSTLASYRVAGVVIAVVGAALALLLR